MRLPIRGSYAPDRDTIHDRVRAEAGCRCIRCGHPDDAPQIRQHGKAGRAECDAACRHACDGKQRILTVHHFDGDKSNNRWWNLLSLCQACHLVIQAKVIPERPYLWEHSDWIKPYVAGFYAAYYGQQHITRAEAEQELERWLVLGQPWRGERDE